MLLPAPLVPSKGLRRLTADSEFNALEPSLAKGPGRVRKTRVFHPRSPADWFLAPGQASHFLSFCFALFSGAGSSVALLVPFLSGAGANVARLVALFLWCRRFVFFHLFVLVCVCVFFLPAPCAQKSGNKKCTRKWPLPKSAPESPAECRNLGDHVDVSHPRAFRRGVQCIVSHPVAHSYSSSSSIFVLSWRAL